MERRDRHSCGANGTGRHERFGCLGHKTLYLHELLELKYLNFCDCLRRFNQTQACSSRSAAQQVFKLVPVQSKVFSIGHYLKGLISFFTQIFILNAQLEVPPQRYQAQLLEKPVKLTELVPLEDLMIPDMAPNRTTLFFGFPKYMKHSYSLNKSMLEV